MSEKKKLSEICNILNGYAFKSKEYVDDGIRVIRITNVQKGIIEDFDPKYYDISQKDKLKNYMLKENDLLISLTGNVGRVGLMPKELLPAGLNQRVGCLRIKDINNISIEYLYQYLNSDKFENECINNSNGIAQKNLSTEWLKDYIITVPSVEEQKKITNKLENIQIITKTKKEQIKELDEIIKSQFFEMFENKNFEKKTLQDITIKITDGSHNPPNGIAENVGYMMLSSQNIVNDKINYENARYLSKEDFEKENARTDLKNGDVLLTIVGTVGRTAIICNEENITLQRSVAVLKPIEEIKSEYLVGALKSDDVVRQLNKGAKGVAQKGIYLNDLKKLTISVPPIELQNKFAEFVKQIDKQKFEVQKSLEEIQKLQESLMNKYFG